MNITLLRILTPGLLLVAMIETPAATLVANGSFEFGTFSPDRNDTMELLPGSTAISGWSVVSGETGWLHKANPWHAVGADGDYFLNLAGYDHTVPYGGVSQTIATVVDQEYKLSFALGAAGGSLYQGPSTYIVTVGGNSTAFVVNPVTNWYEWQTFTLSFVAKSRGTEITFSGNNSVHFLGLDNVSASAVPTPGTGWLYFSGLVTLLAIPRLRAVPCSTRST